MRELENVLTRALVLAHNGVIDAADIAISHAGSAPGPRIVKPHDDSLAAVEREHVRRVLAMTAGNKRKAARILRVSRARLDRLVAKHKLRDAESAESRPAPPHDGLGSSPSVR